MAQVTDRNIGANPTGFNMRTELNNIIAALESDNSGSSAPLNTVAYMKWLDTSNATYYYVKERNHDNTAWVTLFRYTVSTKIMEVVSNGVVLNDVVVHKTGNETKTGTMTFMDNVGIGGTPTFQLDLKGGTTVNHRLNLVRGNDDVNQGVKFGFGGIDAYRTSVLLSQPQTELNFTQTASDGVRTPLKIDSSGNVLVTGSGGLGYGTGSGGTVTQLTSKSTAVTLNKPCGCITMHNASLAAGATVDFPVYSSVLGAYDTVIVSAYYGYVEPRNYKIYCVYVGGSGYFAIRVQNISGGALSEAFVINFAIIKGSIN